MVNIALNSNPGFSALANSSYNSGYLPSNAFRGVNTNDPRWNSAELVTPTGHWIGCDFGSLKQITHFRMIQFPQASNSYQFASQFKLQTADDAAFTTNVVDHHTHNQVAANLDSGLVELAAPVTGRYWRAICTAAGGATPNGWGVNVFELHGGDAPGEEQTLTLTTHTRTRSYRAPSLFNGKLLTLPSHTRTRTLRAPILSNSTPGGNIALVSLGVTPLASSVYAAGYEPYLAFDGNDTAVNGSGIRWNSELVDPAGQWIGVDFGSAKSIIQWRMLQFTGAPYATGYKIQTADDATFTTNVVDRHVVASGAGADSGVVNLTTPATSRYWRALATSSSSPSNGWGVFTFGLYSATAPPVLPLVLPPFVRTRALRAPTLTQATLQTLVLTTLARSRTYRAPTLVAIPPSQSLIFTSRLVRVRTLRAPTLAHVAPPDGVAARIWGSPVPFWFEEMVNDGNLNVQTFLMPFRVSSGQPGRRVGVTILGRYLRFWVEEHPNHPGVYCFPVFTSEPEDIADPEGPSPVGVRARMWGSPVPFWFEEMVNDDNSERKTYLMPFRSSNGGPGRRVVLPGLGLRVPIWIEEHPDHAGNYVFPVQTGAPMLLHASQIQNIDEVLPGDHDVADESA